MKTGFIFIVIYFQVILATASTGKKSHSSNHKPTIARTYTWIYDSCQFSMKLEFKKEDYVYYRHQSKRTNSGQSYVRFAMEEHDHPCFIMVIHALDSIAYIHHFNKSEFAGYVIAFVQQAIPYKTDPYNWGLDYPRYGIETLVDHQGDCEDKACLMLGLLRTMNYDAVLIAIPGHMAIGIACSDCKGRYFALSDRRYFFLETTGPDNPIGYESSEMKIRAHHLYNIPQTASYPQLNSTPDYLLTNCDDGCDTPLDSSCAVNERSGVHQRITGAAITNYGVLVAGNTTSNGILKNSIKIKEIRTCDEVN